MKILYFDVETTGLISVMHEIISIGGIIEIDNKIVEEFEFFAKPDKNIIINDEIMNITGFTAQQMEQFPDPINTYGDVINVFDKYIEKFNSADKFVAVGYNIDFDIKFLQAFFEKHNNNFLYSYVGSTIDIYKIMAFLRFSGKIDPLNLKLEILCKYFGIEINAHNALSDAKATRELALLLKERLQWSGEDIK